METLTLVEIEMCSIAVGIVTDTRTMTPDNMAVWDMLWEKLTRMEKEAAQQYAHLTPESLATSQAVVNASALEPSDGDTRPAQAQVA